MAFKSACRPVPGPKYPNGVDASVGGLDNLIAT